MNKIGIIGHDSIGLEVFKNAINKFDLPVVVESEFNDLTKPDPLLITSNYIKEPEFKIDKKYISNSNKHRQTCLNNRKKRKKRKRK